VDPFAALMTVEDEELCDPADVGFFGPFSDVWSSIYWKRQIQYILATVRQTEGGKER
jgi:hypothetical protein